MYACTHTYCSFGFFWPAQRTARQSDLMTALYRTENLDQSECLMWHKACGKKKNQRQILFPRCNSGMMSTILFELTSQLFQGL